MSSSHVDHSSREWRGLSGYSKRLVPTFYAVLVLCILHRLLALTAFYGSTFRPTYTPANDLIGVQMLWEAHASSMILGVASDIMFAALASPAIALVIVRPWVRVAVFVVLALFFAANSEHIRYNYSHINLATAHIGMSTTFVAGQATLSLGIVFFALAAISTLAWHRMSFERLRRFGALLAVPLVAVAFLVPVGFKHTQPAWMQTHPLLPNLSARASGTDPRTFPEIAAISPPEILPTKARHNLLLVYLEGLSLKSLELGAMETLQHLADDNISFTRYFGNQLVTVNGLYSTMTGDFPYYVSQGLKWNEVSAESEIARHAVPVLLRNAGYQTSFLQSAPLAYMNKGLVLPHLGFSEVRGVESWDNSYARNGWGIDDRALFEHTLEHIDDLEQDRPWFVSVLTTGTHSPYNVPADFMPDAPSDRFRALAYLDAAIGDLMEGLRDRGLLENTVVVLTSDESRERSFENSLQDDVFLYWLPMVVIHPSKSQTRINSFVSAERFPQFIPAIIGDVDIAKLNGLGRDDRPLVFGNSYSKRFYWFDPAADELLMCEMPRFECAVFEDVEDPVTMEAKQPKRLVRFPELERLVSKLEHGE